MKKENLFSKNVPATINAQGVKANGFIFSTQIGKDAKTNKIEIGMAAQAKRIMENIKTLLEENGSSLEKIVKVTVFIGDLEKGKEFNDVYYSYFKDDKSRPVRCCIQIAKLHPGFDVEVEFIALA
ncbi:MAG: RidA family protein [Candidatus Atribacteria bacterium]|nr:RidA family protein [Candidatus Atribacteria bacterium]